MASHEADREDMLREATALVHRAELQLTGDATTIVVGFRRDGSLSIYFGGDPVYQFTSQGALRRAFIDGLLYRAERGRLVSLRRERGAEATLLIRHDLTLAEQTEIAAQVERALERLLAQISGAFQLVGEVPQGSNVVSRVRDRLAGRPHPLTIADRPHAS